MIPTREELEVMAMKYANPPLATRNPSKMAALAR